MHCYGADAVRHLPSYNSWGSPGHIVIHNDQGKEFENNLMRSLLCALLEFHKTRTSPYHLEIDGMVERCNMTCLMMLDPCYVYESPGVTPYSYPPTNTCWTTWMSYTLSSCTRIALASTSRPVICYFAL